MLRAGVYGASGYMGGEVLRVLLEHPEVEVAWATSRRSEPIEVFHPNLLGTGFRTLPHEEASTCDVVFLAVPTEVSMEAAACFVSSGCRVVDLGAAFRLRDRALWEETYGLDHSQWELAQSCAFGIPELHAEAIARARLVANPGCFSSAAILALAPLLDARLVEPECIVVDGLSGTAGAGAEPCRPIHHAEIGGNLVAYNVTGHRHTLEMEQELGALAGAEVRIHFTPVYVPIVRGILDLCHVFPRAGRRREDLLEVVREFYREDPFVEVCDLPPDPDALWQYRSAPWVSAVAGTNRCQIGLEVDEKRGRVVVLSALDSIGKGGAHVGVENMNLMFGLDRRRGLLRHGCHP